MLAHMASPTTALIIDDESHVRTFLRLVLKELGIATTWEAKDGAEGLACIDAQRPELVLLDLHMPVLGGLDTLGEIQGRHPGLPVVVVTSSAAMGNVHEAVRLGAAGYILKQSPRAEVLSSLREILESLEAESANGPE